MVSKRPQDRPSWDEVLRLLSEPDDTSIVPHPSVSAAVEAAIARREEEEAKHLSTLHQESERGRMVLTFIAIPARCFSKASNLQSNNSIANFSMAK